MKTIKKFGRDLKVGDIVSVWWNNDNGDRIIKITKLSPSYFITSYIQKTGETPFAAIFENMKLGMTIFPDDVFKVFNP